MIEQINEILDEFELGVVQSEKLVAENKSFNSPDPVLKAFLSFGGEGWLCVAEYPEIFILPQDFNQIQSDAWPVCGELYNDGISLHLKREEDQWTISKLSKEADADSLLIDRTFLMKNSKNNLNYQVAYNIFQQQQSNPDNIEMQELRPASYRFTGFKLGE